MALTLVLRFADVGIATDASLRVVGWPSRTVTWVVEESILVETLDRLADALPDPRESETRRDAVDRAITRGPFAAPETELAIDESPHTRERIRAFARARLAQPASDAYLAEILAAESDY